MASHNKILLSLFLLSLLALPTFSSSSSPNSTNTLQTHLSTIKSLCKTTPYPSACFDSLKLSLSINITPNILNILIQTLKTALSDSLKLQTLFTTTTTNLVETQKGTIQDCKELHQITLSSLQKSMTIISNSPDPRKQSDARAFLSAAVTNRITCLEGLDTARGPKKQSLISSITSTYMHVSNTLSFLSRTGTTSHKRRPRRLMEFPDWMSKKARRALQISIGGGGGGDDDEYAPSDVITVASDGSGNFTTVSEAINFAPNNSVERVIVYVKEGVYVENVEIPSWKSNIVLLGDGSDVTIISGSRSVADGWTTFRSATVAVSGEGFIARDIRFENTAGPAKHQAVALRINADLATVYKCTITGYQDTLYVHSFRQFYRECDIYGTIDYIFGNAAVVFQGCNIISRLPMPGQGTVITAQSRDAPEEDTGISMQNCTIIATDDLYSKASTVKSHLGRPWRNYSRTVFLESYIDDFIEPEGWSKWDGDQGLATLYYGEYNNYGPGSDTNNRVTWPGYHVMDYDDASNFTVSEFITGEEWLDSTSVPYDDDV